VTGSLWTSEPIQKLTDEGMGEWLGIAPTGRKGTFTGVNMDRVVGGKLVEHGGAANMLGPLLDIGAIRVVGADGPQGG